MNFLKADRAEEASQKLYVVSEEAALAAARLRVAERRAQALEAALAIERAYGSGGRAAQAVDLALLGDAQGAQAETTEALPDVAAAGSPNSGKQLDTDTLLARLRATAWAVRPRTGVARGEPSGVVVLYTRRTLVTGGAGTSVVVQPLMAAAALASSLAVDTADGVPLRVTDAAAVATAERGVEELVASADGVLVLLSPHALDLDPELVLGFRSAVTYDVPVIALQDRDSGAEPLAMADQPPDLVHVLQGQRSVDFAWGTAKVATEQCLLRLDAWQLATTPRRRDDGEEDANRGPLFGAPRAREHPYPSALFAACAKGKGYHVSILCDFLLDNTLPTSVGDMLASEGYVVFHDARGLLPLAHVVAAVERSRAAVLCLDEQQAAAVASSYVVQKLLSAALATGVVLCVVCLGRPLPIAAGASPEDVKEAVAMLLRADVGVPLAHLGALQSYVAASIRERPLHVDTLSDSDECAGVFPRKVCRARPDSFRRMMYGLRRALDPSLDMIEFFSETQGEEEAQRLCAAPPYEAAPAAVASAEAAVSDAEAFCDERDIRVCCVNRTALDGRRAAALAALCVRSAHLKTLRASRCSIGASEASLLLAALDSGAELEQIDLGWNPLGPTAAQSICRALLTSSTLRSMDLTGTGLGADGTIGIANSLPSAIALRELCLRSCRMGERLDANRVSQGVTQDGGETLAATLPKARLEKLDVRANGLASDLRLLLQQIGEAHDTLREMLV